MMSKLKIYKVVIAILAILNVALTTFILLGIAHPPPHGGGPPPSGEGLLHQLQEHFGFDETQLAQFEESKEKHFVKMQDLRPKLTEASLAYYLSTAETAQQDSLLQLADQYSDAIYLANNIHFQEVREICTPEQLPKMEAFIRSLLKK